MKITKGSIPIAAICFLLGFTLMMQYRSVVYHRGAVNDVEKMRLETLQAELSKEKDRNANLNQQLVQYMDELYQLREAAQQNTGYASALTSQLERAELIAGFVDVEGPGVIITVTDSKIKPSDMVNSADYAVHDGDLLSIVNELWDADAEAISINNERLVSTSEIRCAGSTVSVNNKRYAAPYVIKAIGDPDNLEGALAMRNGIVERLAGWGIDVEIKKNAKITIPRYNGTLIFKNAVAVKKESAQ